MSREQLSSLHVQKKYMKRLPQVQKKDRPELIRLLDELQSEDTLVVTKTDRIARSASQSAELVKKLLE